MTTPLPTFEIHENRTGDAVRLTLAGELDLATTPILEGRLKSLRAKRSLVRLDFSMLEFIDCAGLNLLVRMKGDARARHWQVQVEPQVRPQVMRVLKLTHLESVVIGRERARVLNRA